MNLFNYLMAKKGHNTSVRDDLFAYLLGKKQPQILPNEYKQVNYIESTGSQYIDTNLLNTGTLSINIVTSVKKNSSQQGIYGSHGTIMNDSQIRLFTGQYGDINKLQYNYGSSIILAFNSSIDGLDTTKKNKYTIGNGVVKINDEILNTYDIVAFQNPRTSTIFAVKDVEGIPAFLSSMKLYDLTIEENGVLIRHFIPCFRKSDKKPGLYDIVNNVFYTNQGTGEFLYG